MEHSSRLQTTEPNDKASIALKDLIEEFRCSDGDIKNSSVLKNISKSSAPEQAAILMTALAMLSESGTNKVTRRLTLPERAALCIDALYDPKGSNFVDIFGAPPRYLNEMGMLFSSDYQGSRINASLIGKDKIEEILTQIKILDNQDDITEDTRNAALRSLRNQLKHMQAQQEHTRQAMSDSSTSEIPSYLLRRTDQRCIGKLFSALARKHLIFEADEMVTLLQCATERTFIDRANSSRLSSAPNPPLLPYADVQKIIDNFLTYGQVTLEVCKALDQYKLCLEAGPHYHFDPPSAKAKKVIDRIAEILLQNGFAATSCEPKRFAAREYRPLADETLANALRRITSSLQKQRLTYRALYFGLADPDLSNIDQCTRLFPDLATFQKVYLPGIGKAMQLLSNVPPYLTENNLTPPPFTNSEVFGMQLDEPEKLLAILDHTGETFSLHWGVVVLWEIQNSEANPIEAKSVLKQPRKMADCIVLKTDLLPVGSKAFCKFITLYSSGIEIEELGDLVSQQDLAF